MTKNSPRYIADRILKRGKLRSVSKVLPLA